MATTPEAGFYGLGQWLANRRSIDKAIEFVMRKGGLSHTEALRRLRFLSQQTRLPLLEVARRLHEARDSAA